MSTIREFIEDWKDNVRSPELPVIYPVAVDDPNAKDAELNPDGTVTMTVTFDPKAQVPETKSTPVE